MTPEIETIHVLVVDDEASIRRLAEKELSSERRLITTVGSASSVFRQVMTNRLPRKVLKAMKKPAGKPMNAAKRVEKKLTLSETPTIS